MNPHLFVYGTLLSTAGHPKGVRLQRESMLIGDASIPGRLYRIKHYPGLVEGSDPQELVHGEVHALNNPVSVLTWLDAYEGIVPGAGNRNEYERVERPVQLTSGGQVTAWVYLYRKDIRRFRLIPDGRWLSSPA